MKAQFSQSRKLTLYRNVQLNWSRNQSRKLYWINQYSSVYSRKLGWINQGNSNWTKKVLLTQVSSVESTENKFNLSRKLSLLNKFPLNQAQLNQLKELSLFKRAQFNQSKKLSGLKEAQLSSWILKITIFLLLNVCRCIAILYFHCIF